MVFTRSFLIYFVDITDKDLVNKEFSLLVYSVNTVDIRKQKKKNIWLYH